jgi:glycosyltransferase involved in cell wall biosynthesis
MRLAREQAKLGAEVSIVTESSENERQCFAEWIGKLGPAANLDHVLWPGGWIKSLRVGEYVHELLDRNDIVHVHGVWNSLVTRCLSARSRGRARIILAPHGMLSHWSLQQKKLKKQLAWKLWMGSALRRVDCFHVLNDAESLELRTLLPNANVCVLPNGADLVAWPDQRLEQAAARLSDKKHILFLARLHFMKGPDRLVDAFARCVRTSTLPPHIELVIAGPDFGMLDELRRRTAQLGISDRVKFPGGVFGAAKNALLNGAVSVCQPSRHEGFSLTLLEALAHGVPVITTPESNFPAISAAECGLVVSGDDVGALSSALSRIAADPGLRERMSSAGRRLVEQQYTWGKIAERALHLYAERSSMATGAADPAQLSTTRAAP